MPIYLPILRQNVVQRFKIHVFLDRRYTVQVVTHNPGQGNLPELSQLI